MFLEAFKHGSNFSWKHLVLVNVSVMKILSSVMQEPVSEGPVPWVSKSSVTFVAEQVSHHPPSKFTRTLLIEMAAG